MRKNLKKIKDYLVEVGYDSKHIYIGRTYDVINETTAFKNGDIIISAYNGFSNNLICGEPIITGYVNVMFKGGEFPAEDGDKMDKLFVDLAKMRTKGKYFTDGLISCLVNQPFMEFSINERNNIYYYATLTLQYTI